VGPSEAVPVTGRQLVKGPLNGNECQSMSNRGKSHVHMSRLTLGDCSEQDSDKW